MNYKSEYKRWCDFAIDDSLRDALFLMDEAQIEDSFYRDLEFGTGGLRGVIGAGTNRMNVYTVAKATQGLSSYLIKKYGGKASVAIGFDSRLKSDLFAKTAACVFAANNVKVYLWRSLTPVPTVSYATRFLRTSAGVMITASHNPSKYNGYKVYGEDGCQITVDSANEILAQIKDIDVFTDIIKTDFETAIKDGKIEYIDESVMTHYINEVKAQSVLFGDEIDTNVAIVYSPFNGTGYIPVTRTLSEIGFSNILLVEEQKLPNGNFPTCPYPNPEIMESMNLGIQYAEKNNADLLIATDPDCDRVGIAVKNKDGKFILISGNETGLLLFDFICSQRRKHKMMPKDPVFFKTIVTTDLCYRVASKYGVRIMDVLTGFKFIGEQICCLEKKGCEKSFIFGFEESYGYLSGSYVRDKDAVNGAVLICEMFSYYKTRGINLLDKLYELFDEYGFCLNTLHSFLFEGGDGYNKMQLIMKMLRTEISVGYKFLGKTINNIVDYKNAINGLPNSDVLKYIFEDGCTIVVRPSGTEPKLKIYISVQSLSKKDAQKEEESILYEFKKFLAYNGFI